jgi:KipI family sensor histidine kinase inhibitor
MQLIPLGDCAVVAMFKAKTATAGLEQATQLARNLGASVLAGVTDIVPAYASVAVHYDPVKIPPGPGCPYDRVCAWIKAAPKAPARPAKERATVMLPVSYGGPDGPDLGVVAKHAGLDEAEVIRLHAKAVYRVAAVGFSPGFPYLTGLPTRLATPRRATPRTHVPAGSVAIGGAQAGVYPLESPGGWSLIGRTSLRLFRPEDPDNPTLLMPGDTVKFVPDAGKQATPSKDHPRPPKPVKISKQAALLEVIKPGALTTVQDLGRPGRQHLGISVGGAMDRQAARVANLLIGNDENAPLLEFTLTGPTVRFLRDALVAVTGAEIRDVPGWRPWQVTAGQLVSFAEFTRGARAYLAVSGGFEIEPVLGGAGTMLRGAVGGWNGRALEPGDRLGALPGIAVTKLGWRASPELDASNVSGVVTVRFVRGSQWDRFAPVSRRAFLGKAFKVSAKSDRMGLRLEGSVLRLEKPLELASEGVGFGTVQVPPDGHPIVLMADRQTIGGYPKIGHVIAVDLPRLAQTRAGDAVKFDEISLEEAQALLIESEHAMALFGTGMRAKFRQG